MGGICAVMGHNAEQLAKKICENLRHRGPDGEGYINDQNLTLGHRALQTTNIPATHQPLSNEDGTIWITFDGEIYNKGQLIQRLKKNHSFRTDSSAEVVVHAYEEDGKKCLQYFNGMFAFCLWDSKNRLIFSARDRLGMKPLYYYRHKDRYVLASEIKAILEDPSVPRIPNNRFIYEYLVKSYPNRNGDTYFLGINELMPAHYMIIDKNNIRIKKYWQPKQHSKSNFLRKDDHWYSSELLKLLKDSISIRLPRNQSVGTFLSGGLDSSSITFIIDNIIKSEHLHNVKEQEIFSAIYKESPEQGDEKKYIKEVENSLQTKINYVFPAVIGEWESIKQFIFSIEEPVAVFNYYVFWCLFQAAAKKAKIVYSGQGADAIFGGQTGHSIIYFKELWKRKRIYTLLNEFIKSLDRILSKIAWSIIYEKNAKTKVQKLLSPFFVKKYNQSKIKKEDVTLKNALFNDITQHAIEYLRVDDRSSSFHSIACRHPFLDHRIVEFAFLLPESQMMRNGWTKYVLRNSMKGIIPEAIRRKRKKLGTPIPQQRWMKDLKQNIETLLESNDFRKRGYFCQSDILNVFDRYCEGKLNRIERGSYANFLWRVINLELWFQAFF